MAVPEEDRTDKPVALWTHLARWSVGGGLLLLVQGMFADPAWVEAHYVRGLLGNIPWGLSWLTGWAPFSVAEVGLGIILAIEVLLLLMASSDVLARKRRLGNALWGGFAHLLDLAAFALPLFYLVWGMSYGRPKAAERLGYEPYLPVAGEQLPVDELQALAAWSVDRTNEAYRAIHGDVDDGLTVTEVPEGLDLHPILEASYASMQADLGESDLFARERGPFKEPRVAGTVMSWFGISGIYVPFTGEATVNPLPPSWSRVHTTAHEKAHQRLVASEDEANFYGALACLYSDVPVVQYAGRHYVSWQFLRLLGQVDREAARAQWERFLPGVHRDREAVSAHWKQFEGPMEEAGTAINDAYLKAHDVEGGVASYGRARLLLLAWVRSGGPALISEEMVPPTTLEAAVEP